MELLIISLRVAQECYNSENI